MKIMKISLAVLLLVIVLGGCGECKDLNVVQTEKKEALGLESFVRTDVVFQDALGHEVIISDPKHVAALCGSYAETWLLAGGTLAALTEDAYSERGIEPEEAIVNLGSLKTPDVELMIRMGIDFVLLNARITEHVDLRDTLEAAGMTTAYFEVETFEDYLAMLKICTDITGKQELYEENGLNVRSQIDNAIAKKDGKAAPKVLFIRAHSTKAKAKNSDSMTGAMLKDLGCVNIADSKTGLLEDLSMEAIILEDPDFIFVTTQGSSDEAAEKTLAEGIEAHPAWQELTAVKNGRYVFLPKNLFHYKPNHRWGESYEILAEILYGEE